MELVLHQCLIVSFPSRLFFSVPMSGLSAILDQHSCSMTKQGSEGIWLGWGDEVSRAHQGALLELELKLLALH